VATYTNAVEGVVPDDGASTSTRSNPSTSGSPDILLSTRELAALFGVGTATVINWRVRRIGPPWIRFRFGRVRYSRAAALAWLDGHGQVSP